MTAAGAALRFPRNTRLTGPAGSEALKKQQQWWEKKMIMMMLHTQIKKTKQKNLLVWQGVTSLVALFNCHCCFCSPEFW